MKHCFSISLMSKLNHFKCSHNKTLLIAMKRGPIQGNPYVSQVPRSALHRFLESVLLVFGSRKTSDKNTLKFLWLHFSILPYFIVLHSLCIKEYNLLLKLVLTTYSNSQFKFMESSVHRATIQLFSFFFLKSCLDFWTKNLDTWVLLVVNSSKRCFLSNA